LPDKWPDYGGQELGAGLRSDRCSDWKGMEAAQEGGCYGREREAGRWSSIVRETEGRERRRREGGREGGWEGERGALKA